MDGVLRTADIFSLNLRRPAACVALWVVFPLAVPALTPVSATQSFLLGRGMTLEEERTVLQLGPQPR